MTQFRIFLFPFFSNYNLDSVSFPSPYLRFPSIRMPVEAIFGEHRIRCVST